MYTTSRVLKITDEKTVVVGCSTSACNSCKAEMFCNNKNDNSFVVRNDKKIDVKIGDTVELFMPPGKTVLSVVLVFALPLLFFPAGYLLMKNFTQSNELVNALTGFGAMAVAFAAAALISFRNKASLMPVITRIIAKEEDRND